MDSPIRNSKPKSIMANDNVQSVISFFMLIAIAVVGAFLLMLMCPCRHQQSEPKPTPAKRRLNPIPDPLFTPPAPVSEIIYSA